MNNAILFMLLSLCFLFSCQSTYETVADKSLVKVTEASNKEAFISVNQVGYYVQGPKVAYLSSYQGNKAVKLVDTQTNKVITVLAAEIMPSANKALPLIAKIDFSHINTQGTFVLVYGDIRSPRFKVAGALYRQALTSLLRSYTLQRCGQPLDDKVTNISHRACHLHDSQLFRPLNGVHFPPAIKIDTTGGWHDAGDFGKYVTTTSVSIGRILSGYLSSPELMAGLSLSITDHVNSLPDVLKEVQYALSWLLKMQHEQGGVFRKVAGEKWPKLGAPDKDIQPRYLYGIATDDTAKFAATMALAARIYQAYDKVNAKKYAAAAKLSWTFLENNQDFILDWNKKDDTGSGPYISNSTDIENSLTYDKDDRFWAAAELYLLTKEKKYLAYIKQHIGLPLNLYEWKDPSALGKWHLYLQLCKKPSQDFCKALYQQFITRADLALQRSLHSDYGLANDKFIWGSNKLAAEEGMFLLIAYRLTNNSKYSEAAIRQVDYLFGSNPFSLSFVSGIGENSVRNVNHIFARGENILIPGLLVGGPNNLAQANIAPKNMGILSYVDNEKSYAVNEYAIDYNASLVGLLIELIAINTVG